MKANVMKIPLVNKIRLICNCHRSSLVLEFVLVHVPPFFRLMQPLRFFSHHSVSSLFAFVEQTPQIHFEKDKISEFTTQTATGVIVIALPRRKNLNFSWIMRINLRSQRPFLIVRPKKKSKERLQVRGSDSGWRGLRFRFATVSYHQPALVVRPSLMLKTSHLTQIMSLFSNI